MCATFPEPNAALPDTGMTEMSADVDAVPVIFICDFPPSNLRGGSVLISRLLEKYPPEDLVVLTGSHYDHASPIEGRLSCRHLVFPSTNETGRWGLGRIKSIIEWLLIPVLALYGVWVVHSNHSKVIVTIAHGHFFVAAMLTSFATRVPFILIVHDDWVHDVRERAVLLKYVCGPIFQFVARRAAHVYAVSPYMQAMLLENYGVTSELQMPATEPPSECDGETLTPRPNDGECLRIAYAGTLTGATDDTLNLLVNLVKADKLLGYGVERCELYLYVMATPEEATQAGWDHPRIKFHGWATQDELRRALAIADILFLPYSFQDDQHHFTMASFPSKTADYLKSGRPILIFAPPYSSLVRYARQSGIAEVVDEPSEEKLLEKIAYMANSAECRERLLANSQAALEENHNIRKQRNRFCQLVAQLATGT